MFLTSIYCTLKRLYEYYFTQKKPDEKQKSETSSSSSSDDDYYNSYDSYPYNNYY